MIRRYAAPKPSQGAVRPREYTGTCQVCSTTFTARVTRPQKYCSRTCSIEGHRKPPIRCDRCGKERTDSKRQIGRRFCSRACGHAAAVKRRALCAVCQREPANLGSKTCSPACGYEYRKRTVKPRPCPECGVSFRPTLSALGRGSGKYCSLACYRAVAARKPAFLTAACANCGAEFRRTRAALARVDISFCGNGCRTIYLRGERHPTWRGGHDPNRGPGWRALAEQIRERDGFRCRRCGKSQDEAGQKLSVDHVIPWRTFDSAEEANRPENLVALCRSCHAKKARAERLWLKGDVLDMWQYQIAVAEPWTKGVAS